jgi:hypothetical protein
VLATALAVFAAAGLTAAAAHRQGADSPSSPTSTTPAGPALPAPNVKPMLGPSPASRPWRDGACATTDRLAAAAPAQEREQDEDQDALQPHDHACDIDRRLPLDLFAADHVGPDRRGAQPEAEAEA